jgi:hypothetical protein
MVNLLVNSKEGFGIMKHRVIICPAFGFGGYNNPDFEPNTHLSLEVKWQAAATQGQPATQVFTDQQAATCLKKHAPTVDLRICPSGTTATATLKVFMWAAQILRSELGGLEDVELVIVAAPQHQTRAHRCAMLSGFEDIRTPKFEIAPKQESAYWSPESPLLHFCVWGPGWWRFYEGGGWLAAYWFPRFHGRLAKARSR